MDKFVIKGPSVLKGKVLISGSKNAALPILASTLLFDKPVVIQNLPRVRDVDTMISLLKSLGSKIEFFDNKKKPFGYTNNPNYFGAKTKDVNVNLGKKKSSFKGNKKFKNRKRPKNFSFKKFKKNKH